ncbi:unnamed protein product [Meloidogyne enterolobii]|uniref:Uncharacterized protein n=1 Tax=Meloidogyne enterolobii TaxID=390850 RepID=A0ACB1A8C7_MELEN
MPKICQNVKKFKNELKNQYSILSDCQHAIYRRFPQMILVGFAETVVDTPTLQHCLDNCLKSLKLYGFRCSSGMFYFEEPKLNCILNTEDRKSQPELFIIETSDLVDYFETGWFRRLLGGGGEHGLLYS